MSAPLPATAPPPGYRTETLADAGLGESSRRAVTGAVRARARRGWSGLPEVALWHGPLRADARRLTDYQHLIGAPGTDVLPPGFVHVLGFPLSLALLTRADFPLPLLGLIHIANRVTQSRSLRFDEDLTFTAWADGVRAHRRGTTVDVHLTAATAADHVVWAGVSTYLAKGVEVPDSPEPRDEDARSDRDDSPPGPGRHLWDLPADTGRRYAAVSGDRNPIHTSRLAARAFGFPRPIVHGMYSAARALAEVGAPDGALDWAVQFGKPVLLPARVVLEFGDAPGGTSWRVVSARTGTLHLTGAAISWS